MNKKMRAPALYGGIAWLMLGVLSSTRAAPAPGKPAMFDVWVGMEFGSGDVTYNIGAKEYGHKISELEWPLDVIMLKLGGHAGQGPWEAAGSLAVNVTSDAGTVKDSDWEYEFEPDIRTTYSEGNGDLKAFAADAAVRYWFYPSARQGSKAGPLAFGAGVGFLYQDFSWDDLDSYQSTIIPDDYSGPLPGLGIHFEATVKMPYLEASARIKSEKITIFGRIGVAPYARIDDVDDHVLREILAKTSADGTGMLAELNGRLDLVNAFFLQGDLRLVTFDAEGTEQDEAYGGEDLGNTWSIDHHISSSQISGTVALGRLF